MMTTSAQTERALARAAARARGATLERDRLIRQMLAEGASLRLIGEAAGLTHSAIARIRDRSRS